MIDSKLRKKLKLQRAAFNLLIKTGYKFEIVHDDIVLQISELPFNTVDQPDAPNYIPSCYTLLTNQKGLERLLDIHSTHFIEYDSIKRLEWKPEMCRLEIPAIHNVCKTLKGNLEQLLDVHKKSARINTVWVKPK